MAKPTVFVGSSSEGLEIARAIKSLLENDATVSLWNENVFGLSRGTLESLVNAIESFDFALLIITADDFAVTRGVEAHVPRDNIVFEFGLFMGGLGRDRTFGVCSDDAAMRLPTDLLGVSLARYDAADAQQDFDSAIRPAADQIRHAIVKLGCRFDTAKSSKDELVDAYMKIATDIGDLSNEIGSLYITSVTDARITAASYVKICMRDQFPIVGELNRIAVGNGDLRDSVNQVRESVMSGFAKANAILSEKPESLPNFMEQLRLAADCLWDVSQEINVHADSVAAEGRHTEA